jgi:hypothetical protein
MFGAAAVVRQCRPKLLAVELRAFTRPQARRRSAILAAKALAAKR